MELQIQPRLQKTQIWIVIGHVVKNEPQTQQGMKKVTVQLWEGVGLCVHEYNDDTVGEYTWRITHAESGRAILRHIANKQEALQYMMRLRNWISVEGKTVPWMLTEVQLKSLYYYEEILHMILNLQQEISGVKR